MAAVSDNIFEALVTYCPREGRTPKENFLTEAFAYTLRTNPDVCRAWLGELTGKPVATLRGALEITTQVSAVDPRGNRRSILDMVIRCGITNGKEVKILFEHKWESAADCEQLDRYVRVAAAYRYDAVVFIAPKPMQLAEVRHHIIRNQIRMLKALHWHDVQRFLMRTSDSARVREFADFLLLQNFCEGFHPPSPVDCPKTPGISAASPWSTGWSCTEDPSVVAPEATDDDGSYAKCLAKATDHCP